MDFFVELQGTTMNHFPKRETSGSDSVDFLKGQKNIWIENDNIDIFCIGRLQMTESVCEMYNSLHL